MGRYVAGRLALAIPTLLGLSFLIFTLITLAPGDPAQSYADRYAPSGQATAADVARARQVLGLDRPFLVQYGDWLAGAVRGDLGQSFSRGTAVTAEIAARLPATAELAGAALVVVLVVALPLGMGAALGYQRWPDAILRVLALAGASTPGFFLAYLMIILFATQLHLLPVAGRQGPSSVVLPALTLAVGPTAVLSRLIRASLLEVFGEDYIRTAMSKGLRRQRIVTVHALRPGATATVTVFGGVIGALLEGAVITEVIFAWPGLGRLTFEAITQRDYPLVQGLVLFAGAVYVVVNLLIDLAYPLLDARVRLYSAST